MADDNAKSSSSQGETMKSLFENAIESDWFNQFDLNLQDNQYSKGQLLLSIGQTSTNLLYIKQGSIRAYYYDKDNKEQTFYVWDEQSLVTDIINQVDNLPSDLYFEICEDTTVSTIANFPIAAILNESSQSMQFLFNVVMSYARHHRERDKQFQSYSADERLTTLLKERKNIDQKFTWRFLASYIGISRSWLYNMSKKRK